MCPRVNVLLVHTNKSVGEQADRERGNGGAPSSYRKVAPGVGPLAADETLKHMTLRHTVMVQAVLLLPARARENPCPPALSVRGALALPTEERFSRDELCFQLAVIVLLQKHTVRTNRPIDTARSEIAYYVRETRE